MGIFSTSFVELQCQPFSNYDDYVSNVDGGVGNRQSDKFVNILTIYMNVCLPIAYIHCYATKII